jgi:hypothetical protein
MKQFKTVKELMDYLSTLPSDMPVVMGDYSYEIEEGYVPVRITEVLTNSNGRMADYWSDKTKQDHGPCFTALKIGH